MASYSDSFNRSNETPLAAPWGAIIGAVNLSSNQIVGGSASYNLIYYPSALGNDQSAQLKNTTPSFAGVIIGGPSVRINGDGCYFVNHNDGACAIYAAYGSFGSIEQIGSTYFGPFATNDLIRLEVTGYVLKVYRNNVEIMSVTDTNSRQASGYAGICSFGTTGTHDNWEASDAWVMKSVTGTGTFDKVSDFRIGKGKSPPVAGSYYLYNSSVTRFAKLYVYSSIGTQVYNAGSVTYVTHVAGYQHTSDATMVSSCGSVLSRGKAYLSGGSICYVADPVLAKGKNPSVGGSIAYATEAVTERVKLWLYPGDGTQVYDSGALVESESAVSRNYVGNGVLVFEDGSTVSIGKVYSGDGVLYYDSGVITALYSDTSTAHVYAGLNSGAIYYDNVTVYSFVHPISRQKESLPTRPGALDGAITDGVSDGAWTEEYVHGAYTDIGYDKEAKPFTRFTQTKESAPSSSYAAEGVGVLVEEGQLGILAEPGSLGVRDTYVRTLEGKPT